MIQVREQFGNLYVRILDTFETFEYTLEKVTSIPQRSFKGDTGEWMFPKESIGELLAYFENQIVWMQPLKDIVKDMNINHALVQKHLSWETNDDFSRWLMKPYPYQKVGSHFLADRGKAAIFDGVGLGKTPQVLGACQALFNKGKAKTALIVTLNSLKKQWAKEVEKFMGEPAIPVYGPAAKRMKLIKGFASRKDIRFMVVNYETLRNEKFMNEIMKIPFDIVALDEAQKIKNGVVDEFINSKPSQNALACYKLKYIPHRFIATATPIQSKAEEIWSLFNFVNEDILGPWPMFRERYCKYSKRYGITGYMNEGELYYRIAPYFIRRTKEMPEIQQQLPKVSHDHLFLEMTDTQVKLHDHLLIKIEELKEDAKNIPSGGKVINGAFMNFDQAKEYYDGIIQGYTSFLLATCDAPQLLEMSESNMAHAVIKELAISPKDLAKSPKLEHLKEFIAQVSHDEPGSKFVIFSRFERMVQLIQQVIPGSIIYTGQLSEKEKEWAVDKFRNDPSAKVFVATDAGSTGLNLQVANYMIHVDLPFDPTLIEQRNGRIDRTGNEFTNIFVHYYVMSDSYDEHMLSILDRKANLANTIIDGGIQLKPTSSDYNKLAMEKLLKNRQKKTKSIVG